MKTEFNLQSIVPWGRTLQEYRDMFLLDKQDLQQKILGCGDGSASFFDLALSSHFLFLYSEHLDYEFHLKSILEMLRVAREVRIFPLLTLKNERSPYVERIMEELDRLGYDSQVIKTDYEFQRGADEMLRIE
jgi:hypothetical protein